MAAQTDPAEVILSTPCRVWETHGPLAGLLIVTLLVEGGWLSGYKENTHNRKRTQSSHTP
jgi:hypothetical protein